MKWIIVAVVLSSVAPASAQNCPVLDVDFQPALPSDPNASALQVVGWVEDAAGTFVDTIYITRSTGTFGLGNRPGRVDLKSGYLWPYGRRTSVFPVWSEKQPVRWPEVEFQDARDDELSHAFAESSPELHYCRPLRDAELDAMTCPSNKVHTDKGVFSSSLMSRYPPREDLNPMPQDTPSVEMYAAMNPFDMVSAASPVAGATTQFTWSVPQDLPKGDYVVWLEVSKEFDMNADHNPTTHPPFTGGDFGEYGIPYQGQPSVLYRIPFTYSDAGATATTAAYAGYGDPDGLDGNLRAPDATISNTPGSGAGRLAMRSDGGNSFLVRVVSRSEIDDLPPVAPRDLVVTDVTTNRAEIAFVAPGDDGTDGTITSYEIRYRVREPITDDNFATATIVPVTVTPETAGGAQSFTLEGLLPETTYSIGIRAYDNCRNVSELAVLEVTTPDRPVGHVDACFVATAAYGSVLARDVESLRGFRDSVLAKTVLGELAIETYYTFGPAFAGVVGESELLRHTARDLLAPIVERVKAFRFEPLRWLGGR